MANSNTLSKKERLYLEDALEMENLCITKYNVYGDQCQDRELKSLFFNISANKRQHANRIKQVLGYSGNQPNQYSYQ